MISSRHALVIGGIGCLAAGLAIAPPVQAQYVYTRATVDPSLGAIANQQGPQASASASVDESYEFPESGEGFNRFTVDGSARATASAFSLSVDTSVSFTAARVGYTGTDGSIIAVFGDAYASAEYGSSFVVTGPWAAGTPVEIPVSAVLSGGFGSSLQAYDTGDGLWSPVSMSGTFGILWDEVQFSLSPFGSETDHAFTIQTTIGATVNYGFTLSARAYASAVVRESGSDASSSHASGTLSVTLGEADALLFPTYRWVGPNEVGNYSGEWATDARWDREHAPANPAAGVKFDTGAALPYTVSLAGDTRVNRLHVGRDDVAFDLNGHTLSLLDHPDSQEDLALRIGLRNGDVGALRITNGAVVTDRDVEVESADFAAGSLVVAPDATLRVAPNADGEIRVGTRAGTSPTSELRVERDGASRGRLEAARLVVGSSGQATFAHEMLVGDFQGLVDGPHANFRQRVQVIDGGRIATAIAGVGGGAAAGGAAPRLEVGGLNALLKVVGDDAAGGTTIHDLGPIEPSLLVGVLGEGEMSITGGGRVEAPLTFLGYDTGSIGRLQITGAATDLPGGGSQPSTLQTASLLVGVEGRGELTASAGAHVIGDIIDVGGRAGGQGTLTLRDSGTRLTSDLLGVRVGADGGQGNLSAEGGAEVQTLTFVSGIADGTGAARFDGAGTRLQSPATRVGVEGGSGSLTLTAGAQLHGAALEIGMGGGNGFVRADGAGTLIQLDTLLTVGATGGGAILEITNGAVVNTPGLLNVGANGAVMLAGGTLNVGSGNVEAGGRIEGIGTLTMGVSPLVNAGYIAPGLSPGTLVIEGDVVFEEGGVLEMEIAGTDGGAFDVLDVKGELTMGGTLVLRFIDGFAPRQGQMFDLFAAESFAGVFDVQVENLADGFEYEFAGDGTDLSLVALNDGTFVPEPGAGVLLLATVGLMLRRRWLGSAHARERGRRLVRSCGGKGTVTLSLNLHRRHTLGVAVLAVCLGSSYASADVLLVESRASIDYNWMLTSSAGSQWGADTLTSGSDGSVLAVSFSENLYNAAASLDASLTPSLTLDGVDGLRGGSITGSLDALASVTTQDLGYRAVNSYVLTFTVTFDVMDSPTAFTLFGPITGHAADTWVQGHTTSLNYRLTQLDPWATADAVSLTAPAIDTELDRQIDLAPGRYQLLVQASNRIDVERPWSGSGLTSRTGTRSIVFDLSWGFDISDADAFVWTQTDGGSFGDAMNWQAQDDPGIQQVPVKNEERADTAIFNAAGNYTVNVGSQHTDRLLIQGGNVTFTGADYRVDALSPDEPSLLIDGGALTLADGQLRTNHAVVGDGASIAGLTVSGETAQLISDARLTIGRGDRGGTFVVQDGGYASSLEGRVSDSDGFGEWASATIRGNGSAWDSGALAVGYRGWGMMRIEDGGQVESTVASIGTESGALGSVTVTGRASALEISAWEVEGDLTVGQRGAGRLEVLDGGSVTADQVIIGGKALDGESGGLGGTVLVSGRWEGALDSQLGATTSLVVGSGSYGKLEVTDGGYAGNPFFDNHLWIYVGAGAEGEVEVSRGGALVGDRLDVGMASEGKLHVLEGGQVRVNELYVGGIGLYAEARGEVVVAGALPDDPTKRSSLTVAGDAVIGNAGGGGGSLQLIGGLVNIGGTLTVGPEGVVSGVGTLRAGDRVIVAGGEIKPGLSPGLLTIDGDLVLESGTLVLEFAGLGEGEHDVIEVTGDVALGGDLIVRFLDGYAPKTGDALWFLDAAGIVDAAFASVVFEGIAPGFEWEFGLDEGGLGIRALNDARAVPTPTTLMTGLALAALLLRRRR